MKQPPIPETVQWEAKGLCALLNNLERERDEARRQLDGIEAKMRLELGGHPNSELWGDAGLIAATMRCVDALGEITDQRDRLATALVNCREDSMELLAERDALKALLTKGQGAVTISRNGYVQEIERELAEARGQRDRLAKALELFLNRVQYTSVFMDGELKGGKFDCLSSGFDSEVKEADAALKSLTPNKTLSQ